MKKLVLALFAFLLGLSLTGANAAGGNAAPLGMEIGVATLTQVKKAMGGQTALSDGGLNAYSNGRMLKGDGQGLGLDGLTEIVLIFDAKDVLAGVLMTLPKSSFKQTASQLSSKYKVTSKEIPFVGNSYVNMESGSSLVELTAPHMSFDMTLAYLSKDLKKAFLVRSKEEQRNKEQGQAAKL